MLYVVEDIGGREYQEDRHSVNISIYEDYDYVAVFDGHGGHQVSDFLKFHLKDYVKKHLAMHKPPRKALHDAFEEAHHAIPMELSYMTGSAVLVILRRKNMIWVANSGDSRAILTSMDGKVFPLSIDHKPHREDEYKRIISMGGMVTFHANDVPRVQGNLALSRSIGDKYLTPYVMFEPEIKQFRLSKNSKYVVMATDGLWDVLNNVEVAQIVDKTMHSNKEKVSNSKVAMHECIIRLLAEARKRGSTDNTTILFWLL